MSVQNVKVKFIRQNGFNDLKEWMDDDKNIYIGRSGIVFIDNQRFPKTNSPFANPYKIDKNTTRSEVIQKYKTYIIEKLNKHPDLKTELIKMKGKNLG
jgi:hypothetical protein